MSVISKFLKRLFGLDRPMPDGRRVLPSGWKFEPLPGLTPDDKEFIVRALGAHAALVNPDPDAPNLSDQAAMLAAFIRGECERPTVLDGQDRSGYYEHLTAGLRARAALSKAEPSV